MTKDTTIELLELLLEHVEQQHDAINKLRDVVSNKEIHAVHTLNCDIRTQVNNLLSQIKRNESILSPWLVEALLRKRLRDNRRQNEIQR